jgi:hypothetical protein
MSGERVVRRSPREGHEGRSFSSVLVTESLGSSPEGGKEYSFKTAKINIA